MSGGDFSKSLTAVFIGLTLFLASTPARATVYLWKSERGVLNLANDLDDVPETQRATAEKFTAKFADKSAPEGTVPVTPPSPEAGLMSMYERGL